MATILSRMQQKTDTQADATKFSLEHQQLNQKMRLASVAQNKKATRWRLQRETRQPVNRRNNQQLVLSNKQKKQPNQNQAKS